MNLIESDTACCPFYIGHTALSIFCEGPVTRCTTHLCFDDQRRRSQFLECHCECMDYKACRVAKMLEEKYE